MRPVYDGCWIYRYRPVWTSVEGRASTKVKFAPSSRKASRRKLPERRTVRPKTMVGRLQVVRAGERSRGFRHRALWSGFEGVRSEGKRIRRSWYMKR